MEEWATSEATKTRIGVEQINPESTADGASLLNDGDALSAFPTTSADASVIQPDEEDGPHAGVLNEDVLEMVFKHIINRPSSSCKQNDNIDIFKDVKSIRLVCKTWKNVATLLYRRIQAPTNLYTGAAWKGLKSLLEVMKNSDMIPVQDYKFYYDCFRNDTDVELFKDFLLTCGSDVVSLDLRITNHSVDMSHVRGLADLKLEKLKKLELYLYHIGSGAGEYRMHSFEPFLGILLNSALEEFKFNCRYRPTILTRHFERIICRGLPTTVQILHLSQIRLDEESFATLAATGLKLEEFQLDASCFPGNELAIRKFLESQTNTLKTLLIQGRRISESSEFEFPRLNQLLYMDINGIHVKRFSFEKTFPKLQNLDLERWPEWNGSTLVDLLSYERVVPSVKEVIMPVSMSSDGLSKTISEHFPNITTMRMFFPPPCLRITKALQEVFVHFPYLEQLYINSDVFNVDSLFSGVSEAGCKRIWREANFAEVNLRNEQSMPSMLNLTKLKKLVVTQSNRFARFILTDVAAHFVFLQMANLKELSLSCAKISPRYVELLEKKLDLEIEWNCFTYGYN